MPTQITSSPTGDTLDSSCDSNSHVFGGFLGALLGTMLGGLGGFVIPVLFYKLTNPQILNDGQWGLIYLASVPIGVLVGLVLGMVAGLLVGHRVEQK